MASAYDELIDFIARGTTPESVAHFEPSERTKQYVEQLIHKEKTVGLSGDEKAELDHFLQIEHIMRLAKARARALCAS